MAMDEVLEARVRNRFQERIPLVAAIELTIDTNAIRSPDYSQGVILEWRDERPVGALRCCANPKCVDGVQLNLIAVCQQALSGNPRRATILAWLGAFLSGKRLLTCYPVMGRFACQGFERGPEGSAIPCRNVFGIRGGVWVR